MVKVMSDQMKTQSHIRRITKLVKKHYKKDVERQKSRQLADNEQGQSDFHKWAWGLNVILAQLEARLYHLQIERENILKRLRQLAGQQGRLRDYERLTALMERLLREGVRVTIGSPYSSTGELRARDGGQESGWVPHPNPRQAYILPVSVSAQIGAALVEIYKEGGPTAAEFPSEEVKIACQRLWKPTAGIIQAGLQKEHIQLAVELMRLLWTGKTTYGEKLDLKVQVFEGIGKNKGWVRIVVRGPRFDATGPINIWKYEEREAIVALILRYELETGRVPKWLVKLAKRIGIGLAKKNKSGDDKEPSQK